MFALNQWKQLNLASEQLETGSVAVNTPGLLQLLKHLLVELNKVDMEEKADQWLSKITLTLSILIWVLKVN